MFVINSDGFSIVLCISIVKEIEMAKVESSTKRNLITCCPNGIRGQNDINFSFTHFFLVPQKDETFLRHHKEV